jgi:hypothetical protein
MKVHIGIRGEGSQVKVRRGISRIHGWISICSCSHHCLLTLRVEIPARQKTFCKKPFSVLKYCQKRLKFQLIIKNWATRAALFKPVYALCRRHAPGRAETDTIPLV